MDLKEAKFLVANLLDRFEESRGKWKIPGGVISDREYRALSTLIGRESEASDTSEKTGDEGEDGGTSGTRESAVPVKLDTKCLSRKCDDEFVACIDFGTAFSKAAIWNQDEEIPIPLPIGSGIGPNPMMLDSVAFIGSERIHFGPDARTQYGLEFAPGRKLFHSPKELLTHSFEELQSSRPDIHVDPHQTFRDRELLALYLAFLVKLTDEQIRIQGIDRLVRRRFAAPGWHDSQIDENSDQFSNVSESMAQLLVHAQILAESFSSEEWKSGLPIAQALQVLRALEDLKDSTLKGAAFVEMPVLEAVASASSVRDQLMNQRPQLLIVDVGAGTTDIGVFKYVFAEGAIRVHGYSNGMSALKFAGNRLDEAFKYMAWKKLNLSDDSAVKSVVERQVSNRIHEHKAALFEDGSVDIAIEDMPSISIDIDEFEAHPIVQNFSDIFEKKIKDLLNRAGTAGSKNFREPGGEPNIVVFTGGGAKLPFLRRIFEQSIELDAGPVEFDIVEASPAFLDELDRDVASVFHQLAVSIGGASPDLADMMHTVKDTTRAPARSMPPQYKS